MSSSGGSGPSLRLTVSTASGNPATKKRRFTPQSTAKLNTANAYNSRLFHQKSSLSFFLHRPSPTAEWSWHAEGVTSLYLIDESTSDASNNIPISLALHLRGTCSVTAVIVEAPDPKAPTRLAQLSSSYQHFDPLERVLLKPASSYTMDDVLKTKKRHQADSQSSRGAVGMTSAIRAGSIASNLGELRVSAIHNRAVEPKSSIEQCWREDLLKNDAFGDCAKRLGDQVQDHVDPRKTPRIQWLSKAMTHTTPKEKALKVTVRYQICLGKNLHFGGIHALCTNRTPHVYTTAGVYGDHEGPRCWIPCLDSASTRHRSTHEIRIQVTAPMGEGLSVVGFGEDFGASETLLHAATANAGADVCGELGNDHMKMIDRVVTSYVTDDTNAPHLIPPEGSSALTIGSLLATTVWLSASWLPIPARSLGFAIGPFRIIEDPEYFRPIDENDQSKEASENREVLENAREHGEGIRQAYFSPTFARKHLHANADARLLPNMRLQIHPLSSRENTILEGHDQSVLTATVGVPHRALSLMKDILALPSFRTVSYTQIWIPSAVHGGSTSGTLSCCPEVMVNPFLGGSIMDSRLLPPSKHRLPYHHGGRVLQFLQCRSAIRGWILSALPLGGKDDVGHGYIHTLIESLFLSLYERGYGAHGEGRSARRSKCVLQDSARSNRSIVLRRWC